MKVTLKNKSIFVALLVTLLFSVSCERFLNPEQELDITEDRLYGDIYEYRSVVMGLYGLQQQLAEQLLVLGELRADLLEVTRNADADLVEVYNLNISKSNRYASPTGFFKLISACNSFIRNIEKYHPEVLDKSAPITNYDRYYGEALTLRAWAYFNAVRIYGKVPYIPETLTTMGEIEAFINSSGTYVDSIHIVYSPDGYHNDTSYNVTVELEKQYWNEEQVLDHFINELENDIKAIGVNHYIENGDNTWDATIWTEFGLSALLGHMYLTQGDLANAAEKFIFITNNTTENLRHHIDQTFSGFSWGNIFTNVDLREHIFTIWFSKANFQQNNFQKLFSPVHPHTYMLKPTYEAIYNWETQWRQQVIVKNADQPWLTRMAFEGVPSDYMRGIYASYNYLNNGVEITTDDYETMIILRAQGDSKNSRSVMENMDTVVFKYNIGKGVYDQDANYIIYRSAGIHLYLAEVYTYYLHDFFETGLLTVVTSKAEGLLNDGTYYSTSTREELGVRGRVGLGTGYDGKRIADIVYIHDPWTNEILGYYSLKGNFTAKQELLEDYIIQERALELAYEGERYYDLMRVAKRRNDPSYLAKKIASKFRGAKQAQIEAFLMDESNWYINYFDDGTPVSLEE